jgi:spore coat polysaccharide biosynthesis protein SpsF
VATTDKSSDDEIGRYCDERSLSYFRGSEDNVLSRFYGCAKEHNLDVIVRVTSDCPLVDGDIIAKAVSDYVSWNNPNIYYSNIEQRTFPRGFDFEIFSFDLLKCAHEQATETEDLEHVTPYITGKIDSVEFRHFTRPADDSKFRITLDTEDDFKLIKELIEGYNCDELNSEQIIGVMRANPDLHQINAHVEQKKV